ncbi:MAG: hypothetical protein RID09_08780 [Coleofasciculus sp. G1-WW12-02]|uniref:hypothetical protein n=1 Tax=unclassified Coleofasciculus TaxID=2692782 RepID=UPI0033018A2E
MENYRSILTRVGIVLIGVGILEFVYFWWSTLDDPVCILSSHPNPSPTPYTSGSTLLVALGVFFLRGNLQLVPIATWYAAFTVPYLLSNLIRLPFLFPTELLGIAFRVHPVDNFMPILVKIMGAAVAFWVYTQLRAAPVVSALVRAGHSHSAFWVRLAFILGISLAVGPLIIRYFYFTPDTAVEAKAVEIARTEYGEDYKYHILGIRQSSGHIRACLNAYNEQEIKVVPVEWEQ